MSENLSKGVTEPLYFIAVGQGNSLILVNLVVCYVVMFCFVFLVGHVHVIAP